MLLLSEFHRSQHCRDIRSDQALPVLKADHERAVIARAVEFIRLLIAQNAQRIAALQHTHGAHERAAHIANRTLEKAQKKMGYVILK